MERFVIVFAKHVKGVGIKKYSTLNNNTVNLYTSQEIKNVEFRTFKTSI